MLARFALVILSLLLMSTVGSGAAHASDWVENENVSELYPGAPSNLIAISPVLTPPVYDEEISSQVDEPVQQAVEKKGNWFLNPPDVPWMNALGRGIKKAGSSTVKASRLSSRSARRVLSSPEFWEVAALAGAATGAYYTYKALNKGNRSYGYTNPSHEWVNGYQRADGTYVNGYWRTVANGTKWDNFSTVGNVNPYTGQPGRVYP